MAPDIADTLAKLRPTRLALIAVCQVARATSAFTLAAALPTLMDRRVAREDFTSELVTAIVRVVGRFIG